MVEQVQRTLGAPAPTLREYIQMSTVEKQVFPYAPILSVKAKIPYEQKELKDKTEVKFLELFFMPESVDPTMIVCGGYAWPEGKKVN